MKTMLLVLGILLQAIAFGNSKEIIVGDSSGWGLGSAGYSDINADIGDELVSIAYMFFSTRPALAFQYT